MSAKSSYVGLVLFLLFGSMGCTSESDKIDPAHIKRLNAVKNDLKTQLGSTYNTPVEAGTPLQLKRGKELYQQLCAACHAMAGNNQIHAGNDMNWNPSDFTNRKQSEFFSDRARLEIIKNGIKGTPMIGWSNILNETDSFAILVYIKSMIKG